MATIRDIQAIRRALYHPSYGDPWTYQGLGVGGGAGAGLDQQDIDLEEAGKELARIRVLEGLLSQAGVAGSTRGKYKGGIPTSSKMTGGLPLANPQGTLDKRAVPNMAVKGMPMRRKVRRPYSSRRYMQGGSASNLQRRLLGMGDELDSSLYALEGEVGYDIPEGGEAIGESFTDPRTGKKTTISGELSRETGIYRDPKTGRYTNIGSEQKTPTKKQAQKIRGIAQTLRDIGLTSKRARFIPGPKGTYFLRTPGGKYVQVKDKQSGFGEWSAKEQYKALQKELLKLQDPMFSPVYGTPEEIARQVANIKGQMAQIEAQFTGTGKMPAGMKTGPRYFRHKATGDMFILNANGTITRIPATGAKRGNEIVSARIR